MDIISTIFEHSSNTNYLVLFIIYLIEGPVANLISAFLAGSGLLNIWYVFFLAASAELIADIVYFAIGKLAKGSRVSRFLDDVERKSRVFQGVKYFMYKSPFLMILFIKMFGPISIPGLLYMGQEGMSWRTFLKYGTPLCIARNVVLSFTGYSLIASLDSFLSVYSVYKTIVAVFSVLLLVLFLFLLGREDFGLRLLRFAKNQKGKS